MCVKGKNEVHFLCFKKEADDCADDKWTCTFVFPFRTNNYPHTTNERWCVESVEKVLRKRGEQPQKVFCNLD